MLHVILQIIVIYVVEYTNMDFQADKLPETFERFLIHAHIKMKKIDRDTKKT